RRKQIAHGPLVVRKNTLDQCVTVPRAARHNYLLVQARRGSGHVRHLAQTRQKRPPVRNALPINLHQLHMGARAEQLILQVAPHAVGNGESDDERCHARRHAGDGDGRDDADHRLPPLGFQVPRRHVEFESHGVYQSVVKLETAAKDIPQGLLAAQKKCPCAVPTGLRSSSGRSAFPTLKRGANKLCASGAPIGILLMQPSIKPAIYFAQLTARVNSCPVTKLILTTSCYCPCAGITVLATPTLS